MTDATRQILSALEPYRNTKHGAGRFNTPWRSGADGGTLAVDEDRTYGLGIKWYDHKTQEGGNGYTLAQHLGIPLNGAAPQKAPPAAYASLEHYARAHGIGVEILDAHGWHEVRRGRGFLAFAFPTAGGTRYRYADEGAAGRKYDHDKGTTYSWYGLERAVALSGHALILCNGEISTIVAQAHGLPACAVTGGERATVPAPLLDELLSKAEGRHILIALDCDEQGRKSAQGLRRQLEGEGLRPVVVDLGGSHGFDLADFCRLHAGTDLLQALEQRAAPDVRPPMELVVDWRQAGVTLAELQHKDLPPECWIVEDFLPAGACLLAAKPKARKSWLALNVALSVAMNQKVFGRYEVQAGRVLYLDLEGTQRRIKKRTRAMLGVERIQWPPNFHVFTEWPQGEDALGQIEQWLQSHPDTRLIVIDVLADFRRPMEPKESMYGYDRETVKPINALAEKYNIAIILVHHVNKSKHDDIFDSISGTTGLPSAVGTMWVLGRNPEDPQLSIFAMRGRDLENDEPLSLRWDDYGARHTLEGKAAEVAVSIERKAVLSFLEDDEPHTPKEIAEALVKPVNTVKQLLRKMLNDGQIDKTGYGKWVLVRGATQRSGNSGNSGIGGNSGNSGNSSEGKSYREEARVTGEEQELPPPGNSSVAHQDAPNEPSESKSYRSYRDTRGDPFEGVRPGIATAIRLYFQSRGHDDRDYARKLCVQHGVDPDAAERAAREAK